MNSAEAMMWLSVTFVVALTLLMGWIAWLVSRVERSRQRAELEARLELLRRLDDGARLGSLLETEEGRRTLLGDPLDRLRARTLRAIGRGIVALFLGAALVAVGYLARIEVAAWAGLLAVGGGLGLLAAAAVTRRLGRRWSSEGER